MSWCVLKVQASVVIGLFETLPLPDLSAVGFAFKD